MRGIIQLRKTRERIRLGRSVAQVRVTVVRQRQVLAEEREERSRERQTDQDSAGETERGLPPLTRALPHEDPDEREHARRHHRHEGGLGHADHEHPGDREAEQRDREPAG